TRMKIGIMFGNPETTTGGMALKFYASVRIDIRRMAQLKSGEAIVGNRVKAKIVKNKVAPPFRTAEFDIMYGEGISWSADLIDAGLNYGALEKSGNTIIFGETKLGVGREQAKTFLRTNPKLVSELKKAIIEKAKQKEAEQKKD
ncbi:MAG: DNA recombination/repair protein RecA, partial [Candidatus Kerfeldbacteria bacterium CG08_land_8_20_14_0_20_43_14]